LSDENVVIVILTLIFGLNFHFIAVNHQKL